LPGIHSHAIESLALWLLAELRYPAVAVGLQQTEPRRISLARGSDSDGDVGVGAHVPRDEVSIVHAVEMIARQNENCVGLVIAQMMKDLAHGVGGPLEPVRPFRSHLGCKHFDKPIRELAESIGARDVSIERGGVILRQDEYATNIRVDAVGDRYID
jgi:hypothetical protein